MSKMEKNQRPQKEYKFYVVEILAPPYLDPERFVCVPKSWITLRKTSDGVIVKLPIGELSEIKRRAKKEQFSDDWSAFLADVKYGSNHYKDASNYIEILNKIAVQEQYSMKIVEDMPSTSDKKVLKSKRRITNEVHQTSTISGDAVAVSKKKKEQLDLTDTEVGRKKTKVGTVDTSPKAGRYLTRQSLRTSSSANNTGILLDKTAGENHPDISNCSEESHKSNHSHEKESSVKNSPELMRKLQILMVLRSILGDDFREVLKKLHNEFERNSLMFERMRLAFDRNCKIIGQLIELTDEVINDIDMSDLGAKVEELKKSIIEVNIHKNNVGEASGSGIQNDAQKEEEKKHNNDGTEIKNNNPLNKIRGQARKFTLPPEYDPKDSTWTLKHRKMKNGLVELLPLSRVYIDGIQLENCITMSKDSKTLARMLLLQIFSENALSVCSLTGQKANAYYLEGTDPRPGLDEHAKKVLSKYVKKQAVERKWVFDEQMITNTLRNKLQDVRGKYRKKLPENN